MSADIEKIDVSNPKKEELAGIHFWLTLMVFLLIASVSLIGYVSKVEEAEHRLAFAAEIAAASAENTLTSTNPSALQDTLKPFENNADIIAAVIFDNNGNLLSGFNSRVVEHSIQFSASDRRNLAMRHPSTPQVSLLSLTKKWFAQHFGGFKQIPLANGFSTAVEFDRDYLHLIRPLTQNNNLVGSVYVAMPFSRSAAFIKVFTYCSAICLFCAFCVGLVLYAAFRKNITLPLEDLTANLDKAYQDENVSFSFAYASRSRFSQLAETCNLLLDKQRERSLMLTEQRQDASLYNGQMHLRNAELHEQIEALKLTLERTLSEKIEAEQSNQRKAEFLANMSHEIRTPMTAVLGMADFLWHSSLKPDQRRSIEVMKQTSSMLISIVDDIIDFAKIESGSLSLNASEFNCRELMTDSYQLLALEAKTKGLKYSLEIAAEFPRLLIGDAGRISQILVNLLSNAIKFTAQGEIKMRVSTSPCGDQKTRLLCEVTDTGIGINKEKLTLLFKAFNQTDTALTRIFPGTGLGLAISKQLVQLMAGEIGVSSQPGIGSTFWFWLDLAISATPVKSLKQLKNYRFNAQLLVAEDYPANQMVVQRFLEDLGCKVVMVNNGFEAVKALKNQYFDLVFMDCQMPFMDGYQATQEIRRLGLLNRYGLPVPVIALTAHALQEDENRCKAAGMDEWVTKPFTRHDLSKILQKWLPDELIIADQPALKTDAVTLAKASSIMDDNNSINIKFFTQQFKLDNMDDLAFISSLTNAFQQNAAQVLSNLQLSIDNSDSESVRKLAHGLKSISTNVGSGSLTDLCSLMEQSAQNNNFEVLQGLLESMKHEYLRVLAELNSLCAKA